jgi:CheY-like chemotaxis protein
MLRILVVNESPRERQSMALALVQSGLPIGRVFEASDGLEALQVLRDCWVDLMVCDVRLPRMGGLALVQRMASEGFIAQVPVVIVAPTCAEPEAPELTRLGVRAWVYQPLQPEILGRVARDVLGLSGAA